MLRDIWVKKETGLSWVEEGNKVHTSAAGIDAILNQNRFLKNWRI